MVQFSFREVRVWRYVVEWNSRKSEFMSLWDFFWVMWLVGSWENCLGWQIIGVSWNTRVLSFPTVYCSTSGKFVHRIHGCLWDGRRNLDRAWQMWWLNSFGLRVRLGVGLEALQTRGYLEVRLISALIYLIITLSSSLLYTWRCVSSKSTSTAN